ncbi:hypothetical protein BFW01_g5850 [Lasiodiplodia theobromae]|nr:hypothetical protein BFW01_g5850 [Lasiodiplodia theobromae]
MSNLGPLTTTFTPASPDCVSSLHIRRKDTAGWDLVLGLPGSHSSSCLPTSFTWSSAYYSPGICPSGHTYACTETDAVGDETTTIATCCPSTASGWVCRNDKNAAFACVLRFPTQTTLYDVGSYQVSTPSGGSTTVLREGTPQDLTLSAGFQAYAWGPVVRRQSTDETWPARTATAGASSTAGGASSTASSSLLLSSNAAAAAATSSTSTSNGSSSLSTGAKAGIGVGVAVGGLLLISGFIAAFVLRRRRRQKQSTKVPAVQEMPVNQEPPWAGPPGELHAESRQEMPVEEVQKEKPAELPAAYR